MFDIGFYELALIGVLALVVLGPKRLPEAARAAGRWVGKVRSFVANVKQDIDREIEGGELTELRQLKEELNQARTLIEESSNSIYQQVDQLPDTVHQGTKGSSSPAPKDSRAGVLKRKKKSPTKKNTVKKKTAKGKPVARKKATKKKTVARKKATKKSRKRSA
ncbi:MAG: Sec-independent protein translocase protein TatB [Acidiferrobacterales bacterium]